MSVAEVVVGGGGVSWWNTLKVEILFFCLYTLTYRVTVDGKWFLNEWINESRFLIERKGISRLDLLSDDREWEKKQVDKIDKTPTQKRMNLFIWKSKV